MPSEPVTFHPFTLTHGVVVTVFIGLVCALGWLGRRWRGRSRGRRLDVALALVGFAMWIIINGWWLVPGNFGIGVSLPLHICDFASLAAPAAMLWPRRWLRAIVYFWGLGLSLQGFITPDLRDGPARLGFWMFWANHYLVVGLAIYDLFRGYRPRWRDYWIATLLGLVYVAIILPLDIALNLNYGYLGPSKPRHPSLIDHLGPWPWRVGVILALGYAVMAMMVLPWELARKFSARPARDGRPDPRAAVPP
jgi:hypothetical integral membrane protein (TIGR02206 family)